ncbi:MAG: CidA/LrgA family protein [Thiopseudomonas sp.]|nr:CidA/LrgA family protein [Thiopseudomonas sp.]
MLLRGLTVLIFFQLLGTGLNALLLPKLPGPILGLVLLFSYLMLTRQVSEPLEQAAGGLLRYLPVLLLPPAVGVMVHFADIRADFWAITGSLVISLLVSLVCVGGLMQWLVSRQARKSQQQEESS